MSLAIQFVGDCAAARPDLGSIFGPSRDALADCDVLGGQLEAAVTDRGAAVPNARLPMRTPSGFARLMADVGFDMVSVAGNHCLDWGYEGLEDTLCHVSEAGIATAGAGANIAAARKPAIVEKGGKKVALLAYSSILPEGYAAERRRAGCAPMRARTHYEQIEHDQPGTPARTRTRADTTDLAALLTDIENARGAADLVLVSIHWGIHMIEAEIADYQREVARAAIGAGATVVFGHHPHILKGVEFIDNRPVFYSLGNFAIEQPQAFDPSIVEAESFRHLLSLNPEARPEELYVLPPDTRMTGIARIELDEGGGLSTWFRPAWTGDDSTPVMLAPDDPRFGQVAAYLERISASQGLALKTSSVRGMLKLSVA